MRRIIFILTVAALCASCSEQFNAAYLLSGGAKVAQAATLSDSQIQAYVGQYVQKLDAENAVLPETSPYVKRVRRMTAGITSVNGIPLNFKVYKTNEVNAFACADGSVRIYSGLLEAMTDDEALGVVGHEIGHVALKHSKMQLKQGDRLNRFALKEDVRALQKQYIKDGYDMAKIRDMEVGDDGKLVIKINEGILEGFKIKGLKKTKEKVILRELRPKVGKPLNKNDVVRSYQRLTNLDFFESVDVKPIAGVEPNACVLEVDVTEKNTGVFGIGAGYSSSDGFVGMISLGDRNFRGTGDSINVTLTKSSTDTSAKGYIFSYRRPWLDSKETAGNFKIYNRTFEYNEYDENGDFVEEFMRKNVGFELGFSRPQSEYTSNSITFRNKDDKYQKHKSGTDRSTNTTWKEDNFGLTRSILMQHITDTRDNYIYPTEGYKSTLGYEYAGLGGDFSYHKFTIDGSTFRKVGRNQILVFHGSYGHSTDDLPTVSKFMLGGQDTIRGYRDDMFRGNSMVLGNIEYRFPLSKNFKAALFTDFGSAWDTGWTPSKLHGSYGVGVMLDSPLGLIRVDIGHGSQGNRVHFNVGGTF